MIEKRYETGSLPIDSCPRNPSKIATNTSPRLIKPIRLIPRTNPIISTRRHDIPIWRPVMIARISIIAPIALATLRNSQIASTVHLLAAATLRAAAVVAEIGRSGVVLHDFETAAPDRVARVAPLPEHGLRVLEVVVID